METCTSSYMFLQLDKNYLLKTKSSQFTSANVVYGGQRRALVLSFGQFTVVRLSDQCLSGRETGVDVVLIQPSLLFI